MTDTERKRCSWGNSDPLLTEYHDKEWGVPSHDDKRLFEFLVLEGAQAGLNWRTILSKRENYRRAFADFDPSRVAQFTQRDIKKLLADPGIIRNKLKIAAAITDAQKVLEIQNEFGSFDRYLWKFVDGKPIKNKFKSVSEIPATTKQSDAMSKDLRKRGLKFVGSTICYAFMQAVGLVNDHMVDCFRYDQV
jgi:DNA-3-methyladenine glycosylase I